MTAVHQLRNQILALVFQISWDAKRTVKLADSFVGLTPPAGDDACSEAGTASDTSSEPDVATADVAAADVDHLAAQGDVEAQVQSPHALTVSKDVCRLHGK